MWMSMIHTKTISRPAGTMETRRRWVLGIWRWSRMTVGYLKHPHTHSGIHTIQTKLKKFFPKKIKFWKVYNLLFVATFPDELGLSVPLVEDEQKELLYVPMEGEWGSHTRIEECERIIKAIDQICTLGKTSPSALRFKQSAYRDAKWSQRAHFSERGDSSQHESRLWAHQQSLRSTYFYRNKLLAHWATYWVACSNLLSDVMLY